MRAREHETEGRPAAVALGPPCMRPAERPLCPPPSLQNRHCAGLLRTPRNSEETRTTAANLHGREGVEAPNRRERTRTTEALPREPANSPGVDSALGAATRRTLPWQPAAVVSTVNSTCQFAGVFDGRYWARTSDPQLVDLALSSSTRSSDLRSNPKKAQVGAPTQATKKCFVQGIFRPIRDTNIPANRDFFTYEWPREGHQPSPFVHA
jgi:hypothetical protein